LERVSNSFLAWMPGGLKSKFRQAHSDVTMKESRPSEWRLWFEWEFLGKSAVPVWFRAEFYLIWTRLRRDS
jgi:hypothetical protein